MKKLILAAIALTTAVGVFAQGTIQFNNRIATAGFAQTTHIWGPGTDKTLSLIGLGSNDSPAGTTPFSQSGMSMIGSNGRTGQYGYATTLAQLIGAGGQNQPESSLVPLGLTTTFRSGTSLGGVASVTVTLSGTPPVAADAAFATFEIVAWDNSAAVAGYNLSSWGTAGSLGAYDAWQKGLIAAGRSTPFNVSAIGGGLNTPPVLDNMQPLTSFNLYFIPEPSTFALAGLGAAALLIFRRRK
jgi:hypothetical protein